MLTAQYFKITENQIRLNLSPRRKERLGTIFFQNSLFCCFSYEPGLGVTGIDPGMISIISI